MLVSIVIPYAGACSFRALAWAWVEARYRAALPDAEIVLGYGDEGAWSKARAVDDALTRARGDVLVIADADCWCENVAASVADVLSGAPWAMPYRGVHRLTEASTVAVYEGAPLSSKLRTIRRHEGIAGGGIVVLPRKTYDAVPFDPRFVGWGGEDHAWGYALSTLAGRCVRPRAGTCFHLFHPPQDAGGHRMVGVCHRAASEWLRLRYKQARDDAASMRALIEGANVPENATVEIIRPSGYDEYGDPIPGTTPILVSGVVVAPRALGEIDDRGRAGVIEGLSAYFPPSADITHSDRVLVDGVLYEVDGEPGMWASPFSGLAYGIEVSLRRSEG